MGNIASGLAAMALTQGGYFSLPKTVAMLVLVLPWLYLAPWVQKDAKVVHASPGAWSLSVLGVGTVTLLIWLVQPFYIVGLLVYAMLTGGVLLAYVVHRNGLVDPAQRVLTGDHLKGLFSRRRQPRSAAGELVAKLKLYRADGMIAPPPSPDADPEQREAYNLAQELLYDIVWHRAGEADISPATQQARVRFVVDGVVVERPPMGLNHSEGIVQYLKGIAGMDAEDRRRPQQGKISVDLAGMQLELSLQSAGTTGGQRMRLRVIQEFVRTKLDTLGMDGDMLAKVRAMNQAGPGLIIVSGRASSGVTSTLYSLLREHDAFVQQLETLEAKEAIDLENITQHVYGQPERLAPMLASVLRRDPDVVMVDQCPDEAAAELVVGAAAEKAILLGMQATDTFAALARWVRLCGNASTAAGPLRGILCQVLLRKLCPNCREAYPPNPEMLAKANLAASRVQKLYRPPTKPLMDEKENPITCPTCQGSGYLDRTAVFELLEVTEEIRQMIVGGGSLAQIKAACRKSRMLYLQEQALRRAIEGTTSIQEIIRVWQPEKKK
jgi:type II secretory ATPase GspE/PulE/Tfp pilus assembly ATPase PilB-like protein